MSLLSKGLKKLGSNIKTVAKNPLAKGILGAIPGVGTALAIGSVASTAFDAYKAISSKPTPPYNPMPEHRPGHTLTHTGPARSFSVQAIADAVGSKTPASDIARWQLEVDMGQKTLQDIETIFYGKVMTPATMGLGSAPGWGNLARRGVAVAGPAAAAGVRRLKKWLPEVVGGAVVYKLVDLLTGETLDISKNKPGRRMNVLNPRALARANRRLEGFRTVAVRSLKQYGYHVSAHRHPKKKRSA